jgi:putative methyltransferase (TIGR04325 family)
MMSMAAVRIFMQLNARRLLKLLIPPVFVPMVRTLSNRARSAITGISTENEYIPEGWNYGFKHPEIQGWDVPDCLEVNKRTLLEFMALCERTDPLVPHEEDLTTQDAVRFHNNLMIFAYAVALASRNLNSLSILDWGGGLGQSYFLAKSLLPADVGVDYHCKEVPILAEYGSRLFTDHHFYMDDSCFERTYNIVMARATLYYSQDWQHVLSALAGAASPYLLITRQPFVLQVPSFVCLERLQRFGYNVENLNWVLNRSSFLSEARSLNLTLVREFITGQTYQIPKAPEQPIFRGFLFRAQDAREN